MSKDDDSLPVRDQESEYSPFPGQPGYRTRTSRSGLDYMDTVYEYYYEVGLFIRYLFTGRLRTNNRLLLLVMALLGMACIAPSLTVIVLRAYSDLWTIALGRSIPCLVVGIGLLINVVLVLTSNKKK